MTGSLPTCFIAMPITVHDNEAALYRDPFHWKHVIETLFVPAAEQAGFKPILPSAEGTSMIHGRIVKHLIEADMVLCDLSGHNPNVLFELGVRTSLDKPIALVKDEHLGLPFDIQGLNTFGYDSELRPWSIGDQVTAVAQHLRTTADDSAGTNPLWKHFGVDIVATAPVVNSSPLEASIQLLSEKVDRLALGDSTRRAASSEAADAVRRTYRMVQTKEIEIKLADTLLAVPGVEGLDVKWRNEDDADIFFTTVDSNPNEQARRASDARKRLIQFAMKVQIMDTTASGFHLYASEFRLFV